MSAELGAVVIFDEQLYRTGHMANRWMHTLVRHFEENAEMLAPKRTGALAAGISGEATRVGPTQMSGTIASTAPYSMYVLAGTRGPIYSDLAWATGGNILNAFDPITGYGVPGHWMHLSPPWKGFPTSIQHSVRGQAQNNFLVKAWKRTAHNHKSLRGFVSESIQF